MNKTEYILHELPVPLTSIYYYIKDHPGINIEGIKDGTGYSKIAIKRFIRTLMLAGLISMDQANKVYFTRIK